MSIPSLNGDGAEAAAWIARSLEASVCLAYDHSMRFCGQFVVHHEAAFGPLHETVLIKKEALEQLLLLFYGVHNLAAFWTASYSLSAFNHAFVRLESESGLTATGACLAGYYLGGPVDQLMRVLRQAVTITDDTRDSAQELAISLAEKAEKLSAALMTESVAEQEEIKREANKLREGPHESLDQVANCINVSSSRRDKKAVAFVMLALAGWGPDLDGWEKNLATVIRGERSLKGEYHLPLPLESRVRNDILISASLERQDTFQTLNGTTVLSVETLQVGQDLEHRFIRASEQPDEGMVAMIWARLERTPHLDWKSVKEIVSQTREVPDIWILAIDTVKEIGKCGYRNGLETGRVFVRLTTALKANLPHVHTIWERTMSQRSFTELICRAETTFAAKTGHLERMILSTVTKRSRYQIGSYIIELVTEKGIAKLFDREGNRVYVDEQIASLDQPEVADVGVKFFGLVARALHGGPVKSQFYRNVPRELAVLRTKDFGSSFDVLGDTEERMTRTLQGLYTLPIVPDSNSTA